MALVQSPEMPVLNLLEFPPCTCFAILRSRMIMTWFRFLLIPVSVKFVDPVSTALPSRTMKFLVEDLGVEVRLHVYLRTKYGVVKLAVGLVLPRLSEGIDDSFLHREVVAF